MSEEAPSRARIRTPPPDVADAYSAMTPRFNLFFRWFARRYFRHFSLDPRTAERLRELESRGTVVYVMRYASRLDYFLFNALFARERLRLSAFANGLRFYYYAPILPMVPKWLRRRRHFGRRRREEDRSRERERTREVARSGQSMFLFLRTARDWSALRGREAALEESRREYDLLRELVDAVWSEGKPVYLVPLALFWRKGPRSQRRFLNLTYGAATRPTDLEKVLSFLVTYRNLAITVGDPIDLASFVEERRQEGPAAVARKVRRSVLLFLYREERAVEGPTLRPRHKVQEEVLGHPRVREAAAARARERGTTAESTRAEAERMFREVAANMNSTFLAILDVAVTAIFRRMFASIEATGVEKVADYAKRHPLVLVPSHRSYFDFLILSWLFYTNHLVPPHIAARENMAFGPFGFIFRHAGAFFLRRSFEDPLYKEIFRSYVAYLVREGFTQEFFIEGGRSRTGRSLAPRLGILSWNMEAFVESGRRDLFFVPVAITYERLVEESALIDELEGGKKQQESVLGLVRARKYLQRRFGSVFVNFGEPISLAQALEGRRELFEGPAESERAEERRALTESLGNELVERINWAMVANATSVAACALLGEPRRGLFRRELVERMREVVDLLRLQDVRLTPALEADRGDFSESIGFLLRAGLIKSRSDPRGEILYYEVTHRRALDVYRNVLFHYLAAPSLLARPVLRGATRSGLRTDLAFWLDLFYREFHAPKGLVLAGHLDAFLDYFERIGVLEAGAERLQPTEKGRGYFAFLAEETRSLFEAYWAACAAVRYAEMPQSGRELEREALEHFERAQLLGEVQRPEGWNPVTFRNALDRMVRMGILERRDPPEGRELRYHPGPAFDELAGLCERLAAALSAR